MPPWRRAKARARRMRRRSRSLMPPQMPNYSPLASAYSRQSRRTTQPRHTSFASRGGAPLREEEIGVDTEAVRLVLPAAVEDIDLPHRSLHRPASPLSATATDVITTVSS